MQARLSALTTRGRAFVAAGVAAALCAFVLGQPDLLRVAIFLAALPLVTILVVARTRFRISAGRWIEPPRVPVGQSATVHLRLENVGRMPTALLLLEDQVPYVLGARPRFVLDRMSARWQRDLTYAVRSDVRGRFAIGPVSLRATDPFGLVELSRSFKAKDVLLVTPRVHQLPAARLGGEWAATGESRPRAVTSDGQEDVTVREYRYGDDLRRVHWRSSARHGELMVRREEQPWQSMATVFLDTRRIGHRGSGPASSFEWAVSAAASIGVHLLSRGYSVRLATDSGGTVETHARESMPQTDAEGLLLDALAVVEQSSAGNLDQTGSMTRASESGDLLVAVVGGLTAADTEALGRLRHGVSSAYAIVLDTPTWATGKAAMDRADEPHADHTGQSGHALVGRGWRVAHAVAGDHLEHVWARLLLTSVGSTAADSDTNASAVPAGPPRVSAANVGRDGP